MPWWWSQSKDGIGYKIFDGSSAHFHWIAHLGVRYLKRYTYIWEWTRLFQIPEVAFLVAQGTHVENGAIGFTYLLSIQRKMVSTKISHPDSKSTQNMRISHSCMISGKHSLLCNCLCFWIPWGKFTSMQQILIFFPNSVQPYGICLQLPVSKC